MAVAESDFYLFAASGMPEDDTEPCGGDIDLTTIVLFGTPMTTDDQINTSSDDVGDTGVIVTLTGRNQSGVIFTEEHNYSGGAAVSGSDTFERVLKITVSGDHSGIIFSQENISLSTIMSLEGTTDAPDAVSINEGRRMFYDATVDGTANKVLYESFYIKNTNAVDTLSSASVSLSTDGTTNNIMDFRLANAINQGEEVANRTIEPTGVINDWDDTTKNIPGGSLGPGDYIQVWVRMTLDKNEAAEKASVSFTISGSS